MSFEAWGTPPDPEPRYCPVCDQESHSNDCELGKMQARAFLAEQQRDELLSDVERCYRMLLSEPDTQGALFKAENILREAIASVKEK